jgi:hypothetical protein
MYTSLWVKERSIHCELQSAHRWAHCALTDADGCQRTPTDSNGRRRTPAHHRALSTCQTLSGAALVWPQRRRPSDRSTCHVYRTIRHELPFDSPTGPGVGGRLPRPRHLNALNQRTAGRPPSAEGPGWAEGAEGWRERLYGGVAAVGCGRRRGGGDAQVLRNAQRRRRSSSISVNSAWNIHEDVLLVYVACWII